MSGVRARARSIPRELPDYPREGIPDFTDVLALTSVMVDASQCHARSRAPGRGSREGVAEGGSRGDMRARRRTTSRSSAGSADQQQETVLGAQQQRSSGVAQTARPRRAGEFMNEI